MSKKEKVTTKEKAWKACLEIYRRQFKEAKPSADFDKLREQGITKKSRWFMKYYLLQKRQDEIINEVCKEQKITGIWKQKVEEEVNLGCAPNSSKDTWEKEKKK